ncbi:hypothetical protein [Phenylobacterium sp.]|uniref:hypothetical protein n=1 Tax=Phenylobacterium sp. TaxID=1871053 RepID=UPI0025DA60BA|nr:hypothetical protein [Phenylobacterium sp.]MBX3484903.1 hypothetical protein [Phenylobacterium sp.]MCW5758434.1 hypothetical protein [Phenylobacterium sp.]
MTRAIQRPARLCRVIIASVAMSLGLSACDIAPNIRLHNGVGRPLALEIAKGGQQARKIDLEPGGAVRIWNIYGPNLTIRFDGCEWRYRLPYMDLNFPWREADGLGGTRPDHDHGYPVEVQLQPDHLLYLRPEASKGVVPLAGLAGSQGHGFPLTPVGTCDLPTPPA